jgi:hypothetical protein
MVLLSSLAFLLGILISSATQVGEASSRARSRRVERFGCAVFCPPTGTL